MWEHFEFLFANTLLSLQIVQKQIFITIQFNGYNGMLRHSLATLEG